MKGEFYKMEEKEKDTLFLMALAVFGAFLMSVLATFLQLIIVLPLTIAVFLIMILTLLFYKKTAINLSENLENWAMILVVILFAISFIYLFRPA
jgi:energy-converting hydrogenase A subunit K